MNTYSSVWNLGNLGNRKIAVINTKPEMVVEEVKQFHHIHVLDSSGSMCGSIGELIDNVVWTLDVIPEDDYLSVIQYSSEGNHKVLIKGAKKDKNLIPLIKSIRADGCTCFAEPVKTIGDIINDLDKICPNFSVTLFTDGNPVVSYGAQEDIRRTLSNIDSYRDKLTAFNTIGYGSYYNEDFLRSIANKSTLGIFTHSSKIAEYSEIFKNNFEDIKGMIKDPFKVTCPNHDIIYINNKITLNRKDQIDLRAIDKTKNQFVIVGDDDKDFTFNVNGDTYNTKDITSEVPSASITPIMYSLAYCKYYDGYRKDALTILNDVLHDKNLIDNQIKSFTFDEVSKQMKNLKMAAKGASYTVQGTKYSYRNYGTAPDGYLPAKDALCLMDILKILIKGEDNYYVYADNYKKIGKTVVDKKNQFVADKTAEILTEVSGLVFNETRLNISIRSEISGTVYVGKNTFGFDETINSKMYRNQTIVKDGQYNMDTIKFKVSNETKTKLIGLGSAYLSFSAVDNYVTINTSDLPIINYMYVEDGKNVDSVLDATKEILELTAEQKAINFYMPSAASGAFTKGTKKYTDDQIKFLKDNGLDTELRYCGVSNEEVDPTDYYETRELDYYLKGCSALPSANKVMEKLVSKKSLTKTENILNDKLKKYEGKSKNALVASLRSTKITLLETRASMSANKIALVLTGEWFGKLEQDKDGNYLYTKGDDTLIIKSNKVLQGI